MHNRIRFFNTIRIRILLALVVLFIIIAVVIGVVNKNNIQHLYEESYTERLLLTNAIMATVLDGEDIEKYVDMMRNQNAAFKERQVNFYHDRKELWDLQDKEGTEDEQQVIMERLKKFHEEMDTLKDDRYWEIIDELKALKETSGSTYVYVQADTGLKTRDGKKLYTFIFDADDAAEYIEPDMDGLGTSAEGNKAFENVFITKQQTEQAEPYDEDYGKLYFVLVPILNDNDEVVAVLGTDLSLKSMNDAIASSLKLFNRLIVLIFILSALMLFILLSRFIARPLGSLTRTAREFAEGNLHTSISGSALKQRTEIGMLANAFKNTLDATTLYLNSIPESIFIMNRSFDTYFRNNKYTERFGDMQAAEFMAALFPEDMIDTFEEKLKQEENTRIVWINDSCYVVMLREIVLNDMPENSILVIANDITDLMREKENAQAAAEAKSHFLSRMSHEMRTPMNAIIGMTKVADNTDNLSNIRHCIDTINSSSEHLLGIINDILDMSKIEAGKLELEIAPMNIEKSLMKVCNIVIDAMEKKNQKFNITLTASIKRRYICLGSLMMYWICQR